MQQLTHIDLFSGIAGFALASSWAGFETVVFCEKDKYCQKTLNKHWPNVPIIEDIYEFNGEQYCGATLLTGGVPCQPASVAGRQRGTEDDRWLWPETLRIIREAKPKWVILENVRGLVSLNGGLEFNNLLTELEAIGYETRAFVIPACSVNAPHRRERVWIVANTHNKRGGNSDREVDNQGWTTSEIGGTSISDKQAGHCCPPERNARPAGSLLEKSSGIGRGGRSDEDDSRQDRPLQTKGSCPGMQQGFLADTNNSRSNKRWGVTATQQGFVAAKCSGQGSVESSVGDMVNGFSSRLVGPEPNIPRVTNEKDRDRVNKLRSLGNAIVPQVAYQIIEKIAMIELGKCQRRLESAKHILPNI